MNLPRIAMLSAAMAALVLAGCQSERFSRLDTRSPAPAPLAAAPSGAVQSGQLPPPVEPGMTDPSQFPLPPGQEDDEFDGVTGNDGDGTQMAALPPSDGPAIGAGSVAGVWNATVAGQGCRIATPQTRFGEGYRAGPLRCPPPLDQVKSWNVSGSQLTLYDENGSALARLFSSGGDRFEGQTSTGQSVLLAR
jgi:hypothetical protein